MAFHLEKPYINNIGNTRRKPSTKLIKAQQQHEQYLRKMGLHIDQLEAKPKSQPGTLKKVVSADRNGPQCSNGFAPGGAKKSVFDSAWQRTYEDDPVMAERERAALAQAEAKRKQVSPLYSKGAYQYITAGSDIKGLGKKI